MRTLLEAGSWRRCVATASAAALAVLGGLAPLDLGAQTLRGQVLDDARGTPVDQARVLLVDRDGDRVAEAIADSVGRFLLAPPDAGEYYLVADRLGYHTARSPLLALRTEGTAAIELVMSPQPIGLEGLAVEVDVVTQATEFLALSGIDPANLGNRWITRADIEAVQIRPDVGRVLEWQQISGMRVIRPENLVPGSDDLGICISLTRGRTAGGFGQCALPVIDGVARSKDALLHLDPETVEAIAVLQPSEALILYGLRADGGAILLWTRRGGR